MKTPLPIARDIDAIAMGAWRAAAFLGLILLLWLMQFSYRILKPENVFGVIQVFYRAILGVMGFRVRVHGAVSRARPTFFVSNHTSYLDVPVLGSLIPASFVAKADVRGWPIIGMLCARQRTVFIERRGVRASEQRDGLGQHLRAKESLILFPEGTSSIGLTALPFKSSLFSVVEQDPVTIQPISVTCTELDGLPITRAQRPLYTWYGDMTFARHLWKVFKRGHFTVDVVFHPPIDPKAFPGRKALAAYCQQQVARGIEQCLTGRGVDIAAKPQLPAPPGILSGT